MSAFTEKESEYLAEQWLGRVGGTAGRLTHAKGAASAEVHPTRANTSLLLAKVCKAHRAYLGALLAEYGLHVGQELALLELWQEDGLRGGELAVRLGVGPPTVTKMLRRLEGCGLVERSQDPDDARSFRVHLTQKGGALEESVVHCWTETEQMALAGLSACERRTFRKLLVRVRSNLDAGLSVQ